MSNKIAQVKKAAMNRWNGKRIREFIRFVFTGGMCFVIEFLALVFFKEALGIDTLIATPIAFLISVIVNYLLCVLWVFKGAAKSSNAAKAGFLISSIMGLFLNELVMLLMRVLFGEDTILFTVHSKNVSMYMLNKVVATMLVMIWNYFAKRAVLQSDFANRLLRKQTDRKDG